MYQMIVDFVGEPVSTDYVSAACVVLLLLFSVVFIDMFYRFFRQLWRKK